MSTRGHALVSAVDLRDRIRTRQTSSADVTAEVLARIEASQPTLNAFMTVDHAHALTAARAVDAPMLRGEEVGPLRGVPISVKDIINTAGLRTTWGSRLLEHNVPDADAVAVARLKKAGAIIVGKTTTSELAHKMLTDAPLFGETRNPWGYDPDPGWVQQGIGVRRRLDARSRRHVQSRFFCPSGSLK